MTVTTRHDYTRRAPARSGPRPLTWFGGPFLGRSLFTPMIAAVALYAAGCAANRWIGAPSDTAWLVWAWLGGAVFTLLCGFVGLLTAGMPGEHFTDWIRGYMAAAGLTTGAWLTWATLVTPYGRGVWLTVGAAATVATVMWPIVRRAQIHYEAAYRARNAGPAPAPTAVRRPRTEGDKFLAAFTKAGCPADEVTHEDGTVERVSRLRWFGRYPTGAGFVLHLGLPEDGSLTFDRLESMRPALEIIFARMFPDGLRTGALHFRRARNKTGQTIPDEVYVELDLTDVLAEAVWIPDEHDELDVYTLIPVGRYGDGETLYLTIAEIHAMMVMLTGDGKSNALHVLVYMVSRCRNALIWMADLKGAETVGPWLEAFRRREKCPVHGKPVKPPIDWAATNRFEAERMFLAANKLGEVRPGIRRMGGSAGKWIATPEEPAILVVGEEISTVVGAHAGPAFSNDADGATSGTLANLATQGVVLARSSALWWWLVGQRGTVDMFGSGTAMSQLKLRICGRVQGMQDARDVFKSAKNGHRAAELTQEIAHPGEVVVLGGGVDEPRKARLFFMGDGDELLRRILRASILHSHLRPELDAPSAAAIEQFGYGDRWTDPDRTAWLHTGQQSPRLRRWTPPAAAIRPGDTGRADVIAAIHEAAELVDRAKRAEQRADRAEGRSAVDILGLAGKMTADPFASSSTPTHDDKPLDDDDAAAWAELEAAYGDEMAERATKVAAGEPEPEHLPVAPVEPRPYQEWVRIVDEAGPRGITRADSYRKLVERIGRDNAPNRKIVYDYLERARGDRSLGDRQVVCPTEGRGALMYSVRHFNK